MWPKKPKKKDKKNPSIVFWSRRSILPKVVWLDSSVTTKMIVAIRDVGDYDQAIHYILPSGDQHGIVLLQRLYLDRLNKNHS